MKQKNIKRFIDYEDCITLVQKLIPDDLPVKLDGKRNRLELLDERDNVFAILRLPMMWPLQIGLDDAVKKIEQWKDDIPPYLVFLVQAGYGAIALFINDQCVVHENIRRYMVRKKQGKAQINYLKTKGKSRAGSRIRLNETKAFFDDISNGLREHYDLAKWQTILYSCTPLLWGHLFSNDPPPPFKKKDERLKKIPLDVQRPDYKEIMRVRHQLRQGELIQNAEIPSLFRPLLAPFM